MQNKRITKITVYYDDGTYEEIQQSFGVFPVRPMTYGPLTCMVCGELHEGNLPCPKLSNTGQQCTINAGAVTAEDLKKWEEEWKNMGSKYKAGMEDCGK